MYLILLINMTNEFVACKRGNKKRPKPDDKGYESTTIAPLPYVKEPFRYITPYPFCYETNTKRRWIGKPLIDVFLSEFKYFTPEYYVKPFIRINQLKLTPLL